MSRPTARWAREGGGGLTRARPRFAEIYGYMPLVLGFSHVQPAKNWYPIKTPGAVWEWFHPL